MYGSIRHRFRSWSRRQLYSFFSSLGTLVSQRLGTLMTVLVIGIAMALPLGLYVALQNLGSIDLRQERWGVLTVFLVPDADESAARELTARIDERPDAEATAISPGEGLAEFRDASGFGQALDVLEGNPLPWVIEVRPQMEVDTDLGVVVAGLADWLGSLEPVDAVLVDYKWLERLASLLGFGDAVVTLLTALFGLAVVVVVANTIRLDVANRAEEIEVLSLVGAGDGFIRMPFLYSGFWYGLIGAALALVLLGLGLTYVETPLQRLADAYGNALTLAGPSAREVLMVLVGGGALGLAGAWISVARYLRLLRRGGLLGRP